MGNHRFFLCMLLAVACLLHSASAFHPNAGRQSVGIASKEDFSRRATVKLLAARGGDRQQPTSIGKRTTLSASRAAAASSAPPSANVVGYLKRYSATFLLDVCGAAGAIWGSSDILTLRTAANTDALWRPVALSVFVIFLGRFWALTKHYFQPDQDAKQMNFPQLFSSTLVLNVLGGAGAVWGFSEAAGWRTPQTQESWRVASLCALAFFSFRWVCQAVAHGSSTVEQAETALKKAVDWGEMLIVKLVLEVLGATGAVWGFAEIVKLRTPATLYFWQPVALGIGVIYTARWLGIVRDFATAKDKEA